MREKNRLRPDTTEVVDNEDDEDDAMGEAGATEGGGGGGRNSGSNSPTASSAAEAKTKKTLPKVGGMTPDEEESLITHATVGKWTTVSNKTVINHAKDDLLAVKRFFDQVSNQHWRFG